MSIPIFNFALLANRVDVYCLKNYADNGVEYLLSPNSILKIAGRQPNLHCLLS